MRRKVKLAYISDASKRKATYKKRKRGLFKKLHEITTLCGIEACGIIYGQGDTEPELWPSPWGVQKVLFKFDKMPETEQSKKMLDQESFMKQRILKAQEQMRKQIFENKKAEISLLLFECLKAGRVVDNVNINDLNDLSWSIDQKLKEIQRKINENQLAGVGSSSGVGSSGGAVSTRGEQAVAPVNHAQGLEIDINVLQNQLLGMNFTNDVAAAAGGVAPTPFGQVDIPSL